MLLGGHGDSSRTNFLPATARKDLLFLPSSSSSSPLPLPPLLFLFTQQLLHHNRLSVPRPVKIFFPGSRLVQVLIQSLKPPDGSERSGGKFSQIQMFQLSETRSCWWFGLEQLLLWTGTEEPQLQHRASCLIFNNTLFILEELHVVSSEKSVKNESR